MSFLDETWRAQHDAVYADDVPRLVIHHFANFPIEEENRVVALAAAAPELYRALKAIEFVDNYDEDRCPVCGGLDPKTVESRHVVNLVWRARDENQHVGHTDDCALEAALKKAEGRT